MGHLLDTDRDISRHFKNNDQPVMVLCGNKADLIDKREVTKEEANALAEELKMPYFEASALTGDSVNQVFDKIVEEVMKSE